MPKRKKKNRSKKYSFVVKIENLNVQHPGLPPLGRNSENLIERCGKRIIIILLILSFFLQSGLLQKYMALWDNIEPIAQLIEWIFLFIYYKIR